MILLQCLLSLISSPFSSNQNKTVIQESGRCLSRFPIRHSNPVAIHRSQKGKKRKRPREPDRQSQSRPFQMQFIVQRCRLTESQVKQSLKGLYVRRIFPNWTFQLSFFCTHKQTSAPFIVQNFVCLHCVVPSCALLYNKVLHIKAQKYSITSGKKSKGVFHCRSAVLLACFQTGLASVFPKLYEDTSCLCL